MSSPERLVAALAACALLLPGPAVATPAPAPAVSPPVVVHVAPGGSDAATGTSSDPLRTPQAGVDRLGSDGGVVELGDGTYPRQRLVLAGLRHVTVRAAAGASPVLDATGLEPPRGESALVEVRGGRDITVTGLDLTGYRTTSTAKVPIGVLVTGGARRVVLRDNRVHHLGNDHAALGSFETNAHGIAVYGRDPDRPVSRVRILDNEVDHLVLGASEAVVVNGNVRRWSIRGNNVHHTDNIGIDAIGYEDAIRGPARYTDRNRARLGVIADNVVTDVVSEGNPTYWEGDGWCHCAGGIYVDGGRSITVRDNTVARADIGVEVAAEDPRGSTEDIRVVGNSVTASRYVGLAIGGYGPGRGDASRVVVRGNRFVGNTTLDEGAPEVLLQFKVGRSRLVDNLVAATGTEPPLLVGRVRRAGTDAQNRDLALDRNRYRSPVSRSEVRFSWLGRRQVGFRSWRARSGQDAHSSYRRR